MADEGENKPAEALTNSERLLRHLKEETLASRLVQTHADTGGSLEALKGVLADRLDEVRRDHGSD